MNSDDYIVFQNHDLIKISVENPFLLNVAILVVFFFFLLFPRKKYINAGFFDISLSNDLRGLAIFFIIVGHLCWHVIERRADMFLFWSAGYHGVGIFLFLSGYGLTESYQKQGLSRFMRKKMARVFLPFVCINLLLILADFFINDNQRDIWSNIFIFFGITFIDRNFWFLNFLFFWYLAFYITHTYLRHRESRIDVLFSISVFIMLLDLFFFNSRINAFSFPLGVVISSYSSQVEGFYSKHMCFLKRLTVPSLIFVFAFFYIGAVDSDNLIPPFEFPYPLKTLIFILVLFFIFISSQTRWNMNILSDSSRWGIFSLIIGLSAVTELKLFVLNLSAVLMNLASFVVIKMISEKQISLFFNFLGKISFELFLVHGALMYSYDIILFRFPLYFSFFLYLGFIIFLSYLLNKLFGVLSRQLLSVQMKPISASCTII